MWQPNCPPQICKDFQIELLPPPAGDNEHPVMGTLWHSLTDMIKNLFINFDPVHFSVGPATKPTSDMCINEIIFLIRFYFLLTVPSEPMLSYKLSITTQDFFISFIDLKKGTLPTTRVRYLLLLSDAINCTFCYFKDIAVKANL